MPVLASPSFYKDGSNAGKTILQCKTVTTVGLLKRSDNTETGCDLIRRFQNIMFLQGFALSHIDQTPDKRIQLLPPSEAVDVWLAAARPQLLLSLPLSPPGSAEAAPVSSLHTALEPLSLPGCHALTATENEFARIELWLRKVFDLKLSILQNLKVNRLMHCEHQYLFTFDFLMETKCRLKTDQCLYKYNTVTGSRKILCKMNWNDGVVWSFSQPNKFRFFVCFTHL